MHALSVSPFGGGSGAIGGREEGGSAETGVAAGSDTHLTLPTLDSV